MSAAATATMPAIARVTQGLAPIASTIETAYAQITVTMASCLRILPVGYEMWRCTSGPRWRNTGDNPDAAEEPAAGGHQHQRPNQAARSTHPQHRPAAGEHDTDRRVRNAKHHVGHRGQPVRACRLAAVRSSLGMKPRAGLALSL